MTIWGHSLIRRCLLSHPHLLQHFIDSNTPPIYTLTPPKLFAHPKKKLDHIVYSTISIANESLEGVGVFIEFVCILGSGSGKNPYYRSVTCPCKEIEKMTPCQIYFGG